MIWILTTYQIYDLQMLFFHSVACRFTLLMVSFAQKFVPLSIFAFVSYAFHVNAKKL